MPRFETVDEIVRHAIVGSAGGATLGSFAGFWGQAFGALACSALLIGLGMAKRRAERSA